MRIAPSCIPGGCWHDATGIGHEVQGATYPVPRTPNEVLRAAASAGSGQSQAFAQAHGRRSPANTGRRAMSLTAVVRLLATARKDYAAAHSTMLTEDVVGRTRLTTNPAASMICSNS